MIIVKEKEDWAYLTSMICQGQSCDECIMNELKERHKIADCPDVRDMAERDEKLAEDYEATYLLNVDKLNITKRENGAGLNPKTREEFVKRKSNMIGRRR